LTENVTRCERVGPCSIRLASVNVCRSGTYSVFCANAKVGDGVKRRCELVSDTRLSWKRTSRAVLQLQHSPLLLRWRPKPAATTPCDGVRATAALWHLLHVDATEECKELML
jgi:hypothetical protein